MTKPAATTSYLRCTLLFSTDSTPTAAPAPSVMRLPGSPAPLWSVFTTCPCLMMIITLTSEKSLTILSCCAKACGRIFMARFVRKSVFSPSGMMEKSDTLPIHFMLMCATTWLRSRGGRRATTSWCACSRMSACESKKNWRSSYTISCGTWLSATKWFRLSTVCSNSEAKGSMLEMMPQMPPTMKAYSAAPTPMPRMAKSISAEVAGVTSPKPIVVSVMTDQYSEAA